VLTNCGTRDEPWATILPDYGASLSLRERNSTGHVAAPIQAGRWSG
jgi:hypothetical protein